MSSHFCILLTFLALVSGSAWGQQYSGHGVDSVKKEDLEKYAAKSPDAELTAKIQSFMDLRSPGMGQIAPDGRSMFFSWSVTGISQVWKIDGPNRFPVQFTGGKDSTGVSGITNDGKLLIVNRDKNGEENPGLYLQSVDGGPLIEIQHKAKVRSTLQFVSRDGRNLFYRANDEKPDSYVIYKFDIVKRSASKVFDRDGNWSLGDESTDGKLLLRKATGSLTSEWYELNPNGGELTSVLGEGESSEIELSYTLEPGVFLVETNKFGEYRQMFLFNFKSKKFTRVGLDLKADVASVSMDPTRNRVIYSVNDRGYEKIYGLDAKTWKALKIPELPAADLTFVGSWSSNGRFLTVATVGAREQFSVRVFDWKKASVAAWNAVSTPEIDIKKFAQASLESYKSRDGVDIPMFVRRPEKCLKASCPVVVSFHGGPEAQSQPGFSSRAQLFVDAGFVFVEPNVRGSSGYGKTWISADDGAKRLNVITDIEDCANYIKKNWSYGGKVPKIGVTGGSYGGYATMYAMTKFAGAYDAGVSIVGMSNLLTFLNNTAPYRRILRISEYGDPVKDKEVLTELSPSTHIDLIKGPLLIIQGATDPRVPVGEAIQMYDAMKKKKLAAELIVFADEGHGSQKRDNRVLEIANSLNFFQKHLGVN